AHAVRPLEPDELPPASPLVVEGEGSRFVPPHATCREETIEQIVVLGRRKPSPGSHALVEATDISKRFPSDGHVGAMSHSAAGRRRQQGRFGVRLYGDGPGVARLLWRHLEAPGGEISLVVRGKQLD